MTDTDYADDLALLVNTPAQDEFLLYSLEQARMQIKKQKQSTSIWFKQKGAISTLNVNPLKLVDQINYFGSNISSTESDIKIYIGKEWTTFGWL